MTLEEMQDSIRDKFENLLSETYELHELFFKQRKPVPIDMSGIDWLAKFKHLEKLVIRREKRIEELEKQLSELLASKA